MRSTLLGGFAILAAATAGCGETHIAPVQPGFVPEPAARSGAMADPCATLSKHGRTYWYFKGPCIARTIERASTVFAMKPYKGIAQTVTYTSVSGSLPAGTKHVVGEGTGPSDITGVNYGSKFPFFGSKAAPCENGSYQPEPCPGTLLIYDVIASESKTHVSFKSGPAFRFIAQNALHGKSVCTIADLAESFSSTNGSGSYGYVITPVTGRVKSGSVIFPSAKYYAFDPPPSIVIAVSCK